MRWLAPTTIAMACLVGCTAPQPSFNVLEPYGPTTISPPSTTSYGTTPGLPAPNAGASNTTMRATTSSPTLLASDQAWKPLRGNATADPAPAMPNGGDGVIQASYNQVSSTNTPSTLPGSSLRLNGMHVNDATNLGGNSPAEPARFQPPSEVVEISQLPSAPKSGTSTNSLVGTETVVATAKSSDAAKPATDTDDAPSSTLIWK